MKQLIVNADDFGLTPGHNAAIVRTHREGIVTSVSLLANGSAFDDAVACLRNTPGLSVGVHLTLLEGRPVSASTQVPDLVGPDGQLTLSYRKLLGRLTARPAALAQVEAEWRLQVAQVVASGLTPSHLDSHKHLHVFPLLMGALIRVAREFGIKAVRLPLEWPPLGARKRPGRLAAWAIIAGLAWLARPRLRAAGLRFPDRFVGLLHSGQWSACELTATLQRLQPGVTELMTHPGQADADTASLLRQGCTWIRNYAFDHEAEALVEPGVRTTLEHQGIQKASFWSLIHTLEGDSREATPPPA